MTTGLHRDLQGKEGEEAMIADFIDGSHHTAICGRASRNLDSWMLDVDISWLIVSTWAGYTPVADIFRGV